MDIDGWSATLECYIGVLLSDGDLWIGTYGDLEPDEKKRMEDNLFSQQQQ